MRTRSTNAKRFARTVVVQCVLVPVLVLSIAASANAQNAEEMAEQQREVMRQYMEAAGMSEEDMAETEAMFKGAIAPEVKRQSTAEAQAAADFEARTSGLGTAAVSILEKQVEMRITRCEHTADGGFFIEAKEGPGRRDGKLTVRGDSHYNRTEVQLLSPGVGLYEVNISPITRPESGRFSWTGTAEGDRGPAELSIDLVCADPS